MLSAVAATAAPPSGPAIASDFTPPASDPAAATASPNRSFANAAKDTLTLEFDQPVVWLEHLASQFYLDGEAGNIVSGTTQANTLTLKLKSPSTAKTITYLQEKKWSQDALLLGESGLAALTFCEVPIVAP